MADLDNGKLDLPKSKIDNLNEITKEEELIMLWQLAKQSDSSPLDSIGMLNSIMSEIKSKEEISFDSLKIREDEFYEVFIDSGKKLLVEVKEDFDYFKVITLDTMLSVYNLYDEVGITYPEISALKIYCREKFLESNKAVNKDNDESLTYRMTHIWSDRNKK